MPFNNFDSANFRQEIPDVQILFTGLLLLRPEPASGTVTKCLAGIIKDDHHELTIEVTDSNDEPIPIPGDLGPGPITSPLNMFVVDSSGNPIAVRGVQKFRWTSGTPEDESNHRLDARWAVDLKAFHGGATPSPDREKIKFDIELREGLLHTARRTDTRRLKIDLVKLNGTTRDWKRLAQVVAANIYLDAGNRLALEWQGGAKRWLLNKGGLDGSPYRVYIDNGPKDDLAHEDLEHHYRGLNDVAPPHFQFRFFSVGLRASVDAPCMPTLLDGDGRVGS